MIDPDDKTEARKDVKELIAAANGLGVFGGEKPSPELLKRAELLQNQIAAYDLYEALYKIVEQLEKIEWALVDIARQKENA